MGITFNYPSNNVTGMSWLGRGPYRVYKNRTIGQEVFVHTKAYNYTWTGQGTLIAPTTTPWVGITLIGTNYFNNNTHYGLWVTSKGAITASNLTALQNGMDGAFLDNQWGTGSLGGITLSGTNNFESNGMLGLETYSNGAITMNNVTSSWNTTGGAVPGHPWSQHTAGCGP